MLIPPVRHHRSILLRLFCSQNPSLFQIYSPGASRYSLGLSYRYINAVTRWSCSRISQNLLALLKKKVFLAIQILKLESNGVQKYYLLLIRKVHVLVRHQAESSAKPISVVSFSYQIWAVEITSCQVYIWNCSCTVSRSIIC